MLRKHAVKVAALCHQLNKLTHTDGFVIFTATQLNLNHFSLQNQRQHHPGRQFIWRSKALSSHTTCTGYCYSNRGTTTRC